MGRVIGCLMALFTGAGAALADLPGVNFDRMPVGCLIYNRYDNGNQWVEYYAGKSGTNHIIRTYERPEHAGQKAQEVSTITYDANGFMVKRVWATGKWERFTPFSCFSRPGDCTYTYRNADGLVETFKGKVRKSGKSLVSSGGFVGQAPFNDSTLRLGPFGNIESYTEGSTQFKVVKYADCGL